MIYYNILCLSQDTSHQYFQSMRENKHQWKSQVSSHPPLEHRHLLQRPALEPGIVGKTTVLAHVSS